MKEDFAIFILSHNRARNIDTLSMLKKYHYSGKYYVVISTDDGQIEDYKRLVDKDKLLIFNKVDYFEAQDTFVGSQRPVISASLYARNYILESAKRMGLKHFIMADDDIREILFRYESEGKMKACKMERIDDSIMAMREFLDSSKHIGGLCLALDDGYFGGLHGYFSKGVTRKIFQFMMFKTSEEWQFVGVRCEDFILSLLHKDRLFFAVWLMSIQTPKMSTNSGGIEYTKDLYYEPLFSMVVAPSGVEALPSGKRKIVENKILPKIISSKYKRT